MNFEVGKINDNFYRIIMPYVCCYLIIGEERALLLDTGFGYGDLKTVVESITDLPYTVVLTHGHCDHIGGASQFDEVYLNEKDFKIAQFHQKVIVRRSVWKEKGKPSNLVENKKMWQTESPSPYLLLSEETVFSLGGITVRPFNMPGHSPGSMVFLVEELKLAVFGDACSHPTVMTLPSSTDVETFYHAMKTFKQYESLYDDVYVNHEDFRIDKIVLDNNIEVAERILNGTDKKIAITVGGMPSLAAREKEEWLPHNPELIGNILYKK